MTAPPEVVTSEVVASATTVPAAVEARGLTRTFPSPDGGTIPVLRDVDLVVEPGDSVEAEVEKIGVLRNQFVEWKGL